MTDNNRFLYLLKKYKDGSCSSGEYDEFFSLLMSNSYDDLVKESIGEDYYSDMKVGSGIPPHVAQEIMRNILSADDKVHQLVPRKRPGYSNMVKWVAAACILALLLTASFLYFNHKTGENFVAIIPKADIIKKNPTTEALRTKLPDGSIVVLQPGSRIHYPAAFDTEQREVYLEGDAHFSVAHDAEKPFFVYCNDLVTRVLGTSFDVITNEKNGDIEVSVKTGRVQVYENEKFIRSVERSKPVILTANQRLLYSKETQKIIATLVEKPVPVMDKPALLDSTLTVVTKTIEQQVAPTFVYDQSSLATVFEDIQKTYGIDIVVQNSNIRNCVFTGDVSNKDLFVLLKIICLSTNSDYEVMGTKILIKGKGCR